MELKTEEHQQSDNVIHNYNFDDIRAYYDNEVKDTTQKLITDPLFMQLVNYLWPNMTFNEVKEKANRVNSNIDFQLQFMHGAIRKIIELTTNGLSSDGFQYLQPNKSYLFIANHRDILLDAAIMQVLLVENGFSTSEITFGNNLKQEGFVTEFLKLNRMITAVRDGSSKELYEFSKKLSAYIRHTLLDKNVSVWIAQRNGRTKDGNDFTQNGLLKMLNMSGSSDLIESFRKLNIVPLSISYEYEPCDDYKTNELYQLETQSKYNKLPGEDLKSTINGIQQFKGRVHLSVGKPISDVEYNNISLLANDNEKIKAITTLIDNRIYSNYKLNAINYIAADLLNQSDDYLSNYTIEEKENFVSYMNQKLKNIPGSREKLELLFLKQYARPLMNKLQNR